MSKILLVGIDAHSKNNTACFIDQEGNIVLKSFSFPNNLSGATELEQKIVKVMQKGSFTSLKVATEEITGSGLAISHLHFPLNFFN
jgi:activator of 2-hydroxyglutaryl-CoA dehydratase